MKSPSVVNERPRNWEELSQSIHAAEEAGSQVRIAGSGSMPLTRFEEGRAVQSVSMLRMNKVIEHAVGDMTVIVQAGITLEALQKELAWRNQWLPVDPPVIGRDGRVPGIRTIGGLIASNSLGPLRFGSGDWRLFIMGMKWVDAEGRLVKGGGRTVKNVAGYSTPRMMIGSCGTLGVIAEVALRTFARPADEKAVIFYCRDAVQAEELLAAVMLSSTTPAYVQVVGGRTFAGNPLGLPASGRGGGVVVVVGYLGREEVCGAQVEQVRELTVARGSESIAQTAAQCGRLRLWMTTEPALGGGGGGEGVGFRMQVRSSQAAMAVEGLEDQPDGEAWVVSEAGTGVVRGSVRGVGAQKRVTELALRVGGKVWWTQGGSGENHEDAMAVRIKREIDPARVFGSLSGKAE